MLGGQCLTSPRGRGGLPGRGVYTQSRKMSGSLPDEVRGEVSHGVGLPEARKRGVRGSKRFHVAGMQTEVDSGGK